MAPFMIQAAPVAEPLPLPGDLPVGSEAIGLPLEFPLPVDLEITSDTNCWMAAGGLGLDLYLPPGAPDDIRVVAYLVDTHYHWYQKKLETAPAGGQHTRITIDMTSGAAGWEPRGHHAAWHHRVRLTPRRIGLRFFSDNAFEGLAAIDNLHAIPAPSMTATVPVFERVSVMTPEATVYEPYELSVTLPDIYNNPFDPSEIRLNALIEEPDGAIREINGFYYQSYHRLRGEPRDRLIPQGAPHWRIRYTPVLPGAHQMTLTVQDRFGTNSLVMPVFRAAPALSPGFVRVSEEDTRFFEFSDGTSFFPIGHNLRSPFDERMNIQFPWKIRHSESATVYDRYFRDMQAHGETMTEIWMAPWSLGLEWSPTFPGYHGIGQYNLIHAWELDQILTSAARHGIYVSLTIHNHGKFSLHWDQEWDQNPYNQAIGGYLATPEEYFTSSRAMADFEQMMTYIIARWGYSPHVFAWKLWNELDLTGSQRERVNHMRPEVVEWHRLMAGRVKAMDTYRHLIGTHFCGDFTHQNPKIIELPEIDFALVDAYHGNPDPLHIVGLMRRTAEFNRQFDKPVVITEFGGSPYGATLQHLDGSLHAALWSSVAIPLGGTPMLWWWGLIEEQGYYSKFKALANFLDGEDRRNPEAALRSPAPFFRDSPDVPAQEFQTFFFSDGQGGLGWLLDTQHFLSGEPRTVTGLSLPLGDMTSGHYEVEFWDTRRGVRVSTIHTATSESRLIIPVSEFSRDLAYKVRRLK